MTRRRFARRSPLSYPIIQLITLTILTIYALIISIYSLLTLPATTPNINTTTMMSFAAANLAIDFVNLLFYLVDANKIERKCCCSKRGLRHEDGLARDEEEGDNSIESTSNLSYVGNFPGSDRVKVSNEGGESSERRKGRIILTFSIYFDYIDYD